jgi:hypothetical protein
MKKQSELILEPRYIASGDEFEEGESTLKMPKWRYPQTDLQRKLLSIFGMKYWPRTAKQIRSSFIIIEKSAQPTTVAITPEWPIEWIDFCIEWTRKKRKSGKLVNIAGFMSLLKDEEAKHEYIKGVRRKNKESTFNKESDEPYAQRGQES